MRSIQLYRRRMAQLQAGANAEPTGVKIWGKSKLQGQSYAELFRLPVAVKTVGDGGDEMIDANGAIRWLDGVDYLGDAPF